MTAVLYVIAALIILPAVYWLMWREDFSGIRSEWYYRQELKQRAPMSAEQFHRLYYAASGIPAELVERFRRFMGKCWGVEAARLLPEDDFVRMHGVDITDFVGDLEEEFRVQIPEGELSTLDTSFDGLLRRIHVALNGSSMHKPDLPRSGGACVPTQSVGTRM